MRVIGAYVLKKKKRKKQRTYYTCVLEIQSVVMQTALIGGIENKKTTLWFRLKKKRKR